jgi:diguanylate cyclase (GGDEF)-like protein
VFALVFDIDSMETINKIHGFALGSLLLKEVDIVLDEVCSRDSDALMAHRCGDDTYFLIFKGREGEAIDLADNILKRIRHVPARVRRKDVFVTASAGIAKMGWNNAAMVDLERAYYACAEARRKGGNSVEINKTPQYLDWS